jgi:hypothetical protein
MGNEISLNGLPKEIQEKIFHILGRDTLPVKKVTIQEILPELDLPTEKKEQLLKVLSPEFKEQARQHERLERLVQKDRTKPDSTKAIQTLREVLNEQKRKRDNG